MNMKRNLLKFLVFSIIGLIIFFILDLYSIGNNHIIYLIIYLVILAVSLLDIKSISYDKLKIEFNKVKEQLKETNLQVEKQSEILSLTMIVLQSIISNRLEGEAINKINNFLFNEYLPGIKNSQTEDLLKYRQAWGDFDNYHAEHAISSIKDEEARKQKENYAQKKLLKATDEFLEKMRSKL